MIPISLLNLNKISSLDTKSNYYLICKARLEIKSMSLCHLKKENSSQKYNLQSNKEGGFSEEIYLVFSIIYQVKSLIKP